MLKSRQQLLEAQNTGLEERVAAEVKKCRDKGQALMQNEKWSPSDNWRPDESHAWNGGPLATFPVDSLLGCLGNQ